MGFRALRVINDDRVAPGGGFPTHPHRDMEIVTYVLEGALEHKDSMGNGSVIRAGDVQYMGAGAGVTHSEFNHSQTEPVHLLQIWLLPERKGLKPAYKQVALRREQCCGKLEKLPLPIRQDAALHAGVLAKDQAVTLSLGASRYAWVHVADGAVTLNGQSMRAGDGAAVSNESKLNILATDASEVLVFDLA
jgi:redox-sensitive bicupin YhaK (pirin superfamily)